MYTAECSKQWSIRVFVFIGVALLHALLIYSLLIQHSASLEMGSEGALDMTEGAASGGLLKFVPVFQLPHSVYDVEAKEDKIAVQVDNDQAVDFHHQA